MGNRPNKDERRGGGPRLHSLAKMMWETGARGVLEPASRVMPGGHVVRQAVKSGAVTYGDILKEMGLQADTAVKNATNQLTFGQGNRIAAVLDTAVLARIDPRLHHNPQALMDTYQRRLQAYEDRDDYDREHRRGAQVAGQIAGGVVGVAGAPEVAAVKGLYLASQATRAARTARESAAAAKAAGEAMARLVGPRRVANATRDATTAAVVGGAGSGVVGQAASDAIQGQFNPREYIGAAIGGGIDGLTSKYGGASIGGFAGGAGEAAVDALMKGEPISIDQLMQHGTTAALGGRAGRRLGLDQVNAMTSNEKGQLGEMMSLWNSIAHGAMPVTTEGKWLANLSDLDKPHWDLNGGGYSIPDQILKDGRAVEAKMGPYARLSPRQRQLQTELGEKFLYDHWQPEHFGNAVGVAGSSAALAAQEPLPDQRDIDPVTRELFRTYRRPDSWFSF